MRRLILLRHGEAAPAGGGSDLDRDLTEAGRRQASAAGRALAGPGVSPDLALVSPAKRTQETWAAVAEAFDAVPPRTEKALLHTSAQTMLRLAQAQEADTVLLVSHNPGLAELAQGLSRRSRDGDAARALAATGFPPASAAVFVQDEAGGWRFEAFLPPDGSA